MTPLNASRRCSWPIPYLRLGVRREPPNAVTSRIQGTSRRVLLKEKGLKMRPGGIQAWRQYRFEPDQELVKVDFVKGVQVAHHGFPLPPYGVAPYGVAFPAPPHTLAFPYGVV